MAHLLPFVAYRNGIEFFAHQIKLSIKNGIYQAELAAIDEAVKWFVVTPI